MTTTDTTTADVAAGPTRSSRQRRTRAFKLQQVVPFAALIALFAFFSANNGSTFYASSNLMVILQQTVVLAVVAYGMTFVIVSGSIDLSVGSVVALTGVVTAMMAENGGSQLLAVAVALAVGLVAGVVNGVVFAFGRIPSFIVTLGMLQVARGLTLELSDGAAKPVPFGGILGNLGVMPWILIVGLVITVLAAFLFQLTLFGRRVKAIGGNERVATLAGVPSRRVKVFVFAFSGFMAGVGGVILASRLGTGSPTAGTGFELDVIAAVVIGGTPLTGGLGRITGTLVGAVIISMLSNGLVLMGVGDATQQIVKGVVLAAAVFISLERGKIGVIK